jgi:hypothetical protein
MNDSRQMMQVTACAGPYLGAARTYATTLGEDRNGVVS